ncbi:serine/threonine-protein kinase [Streptomyces sp. SBR177]
MGRYRILARLGAGGMGRVYLGRSTSGRMVAVKVVRAELSEDPDFLRRFAREVEAARRVTGFFTAAVVDADPEGSPAWLATAYVPGLALDAAVQAHGAWPRRSLHHLGAGLVEALEAIHGTGLIHRDLKPSNVLLATDGPRVIDFGISLATESSVLTQTGMVIGTPGYMSPEQVTGHRIGPASDVFSLGAVLAFAGTGKSPSASARRTPSTSVRCTRIRTCAGCRRAPTSWPAVWRRTRSAARPCPNSSRSSPGCSARPAPTPSAADCPGRRTGCRHRWPRRSPARRRGPRRRTVLPRPDPGALRGPRPGPGP